MTRLAARLLRACNGAYGSAAALAGRRRDERRHAAKRSTARGFIFNAVQHEKQANRYEAARMEIEQELCQQARAAADDARYQIPQRAGRGPGRFRC